MVILGRQQLFTENTITVVLPLLAEFTRRNLFLTARIWGVVLGANMLGTLCAALFCTYSPALGDDLRSAMLDLGQHGLSHDWWGMLFRGISAGFLIAAGGFTHIVAGSVEGFMLVLDGQWSALHMLTHFWIPALLGNSIGVSYAQVMEEMSRIKDL